ncbi:MULTISPECIES: hypothetical protein [unclassified Variovorax]|uniref:hypothetical protein n=1 Tax=unclassified Variovorax TaxID=663243 RepID=UPI00131653BA|nr:MULTISPECIES: hypothetical protein [unclassified Variovorax]VTU41666.1 hypothetical protein SRS16P1_00064 [Variovorax sp. SRS16]VTU41705.1 hypothetical protein E5P1_00064 [Variovorax sp. PBL-E5]VTU44717.1 hypothetical protein H6P1_00870 [Variovorax sp. PBL-H6]
MKLKSSTETMLTLNVELNAAEGGEDAALLVEDQARILSNHIVRAGGKVHHVSRAKG